MSCEKEITQGRSPRGTAMKKKKKSTVGGEDENRFGVAVHRPGRNSSNAKVLCSSNPTNDFNTKKSQKSAAPAENASLSLLFARETKENRTLQPKWEKNDTGIAPERHLPNWLCQSRSSNRPADGNSKPEKKKGIWSWGSVRSVTRLSCDRLPCLFSVYIDAINGLPFSMNAHRLIVKFQRDRGRTVQTKPCRVINGTADIDDTLQIQSTVCRSKAKHDCHYSPTAFSVCVCAIDLGAMPLSTHSLDLTGVFPRTLDDLSGPQKVSTWATALKLRGKAKGGVLVVTFACRILENANAGTLPSIPRAIPHIGSPCMSVLDLNDAPSFEPLTSEEPFAVSEVAEESFQHLDREPDDSASESICSNANNDWASNLEAKLGSRYEEKDDLEVSAPNPGSPLAPATPTKFRQDLEARNEGNDTVFYSSSEEEMEFSVVEQGVEMGTLLRTETNPVEPDGNVAENRQKGTNCRRWDGERANCGYREQMQLIEEELARLEARLETESGLKENPPACGGWKGLVEDNDEAEEAFLDGIGGSGHKQIIIGSSDDDIDSVAGEFLDLLEGGQSVNDINLGSGLNDPHGLLLRELEQEGSLETTLNRSPDLEEKTESLFMDAMELEIQKAEQALRSKARAKILEDAEAEALMRQWGLNEKAFEFSPPKAASLSAFDNSMVNLMSSPPLADGIGLMVQTRDGGYLRSMNPMSFAGSKVDGKLVMQVSKPVVVPAEMGSNAMDILRKMAALGMDSLASQAMLSMPMDDITGKTIQQLTLGGSSNLEAPCHGVSRLLSSGRGCAQEETGNHLSLFNSGGAVRASGVNSAPLKERFKSGGKSFGLQTAGDSLDECVSLEDLAPLALQKIESLALEGLKIQTDMTDQDAPSSVDPMPLLSFENRHAKKGGAGPGMIDGVTGMHLLASKRSDESAIQSGGITETAISLDKWMKLDVVVNNEDENKDHTNDVKDAPQAVSGPNLENDSTRRKSNNSWMGCMNDTLTIAMLVQLRDPLRNYEPVGAPMIALIQAERIIKPPRPKLSKQVPMRGSDEPEEEPEELKPVQQQPQFKITEVHMAGLKTPEPDKKKGWFFQKWGSKKQEQSASRWLIANGMGKKTKPLLLKSKPSSSQSMTTVKPGETLWSISSRVHGTGSKWQEIASLNPHIRNPDIIFANQTIRTK